MIDFPHKYVVSAAAIGGGEIALRSDRVPVLRSASPAEFGGPGDRWSPETLLVGAVADCFLLTFEAVAKASRVAWTAARCEVTGTLDRIERVIQFTHFDMRVTIEVPAGVDPEQVRRLAEKAERNCLITSSLKGAVHLETTVQASTLTGA